MFTGYIIFNNNPILPIVGSKVSNLIQDTLYRIEPRLPSSAKDPERYTILQTELYTKVGNNGNKTEEYRWEYLGCINRINLQEYYTQVGIQIGMNIFRCRERKEPILILNCFKNKYGKDNIDIDYYTQQLTN